jgi:hypothetical protein
MMMLTSEFSLRRFPMAKFGVGVGEEFPVDEPSKTEPQTQGPERPCGPCGFGYRSGGRHFTHVLFRVAIIALVIAGIASLFRPHFYPYAYGPYGYYPYPHHFFFFPFFPVLLIGLFILFAWRGGRHRRWRRWHDEHRGPRGEA